MTKTDVALDSIFSSLFPVSEEILDKNIDNFILHNLKEKNSLKNTHNIFYNYLNLSKEYFICYYEKRGTTLTIIDLIEEHLKNKNNDNRNLLVYFEDYFLLFYNSRFYYFQKIEKELLVEDINEYINKRFNFTIEETYHLNSSDLHGLKKEKTINTSLNYTKNLNDVKIYYSYLMIIFFIGLSFFTYDYYDKSLKEKQRAMILEKEILQNSKKRKDTLYYKISLLLDEIGRNSLKIKKFDFRNKSLNMTLVLNNSADAYTFLQKYKNIKVLSFKKTKDSYEITSELTF